MGKLNTLHQLSTEKYAELGQYLTGNFLVDLWPRLIAVCFLGLSFWFGVRRRNLQLGFIFFILTLFITLAVPLIKLAGIL